MRGPDLSTATCSRRGATRLRPAATMIHRPRTRYACRPTRSVSRPSNLLSPCLITWLRTAPACDGVWATACVAPGRGLRSTQSSAVAFVAAHVAPSWPLSPTSIHVRSGTTRSRRSCAGPYDAGRPGQRRLDTVIRGIEPRTSRGLLRRSADRDGPCPADRYDPGLVAVLDDDLTDQRCSGSHPPQRNLRRHRAMLPNKGSAHKPGRVQLQI